MVTLDDILQVSIGVSSCGLLAALAFKLLRIMTRHNVLLTGQSLGEANGTANVKEYPRRFRYRLRIQSLEATRTEYPMEVTIKGFPNGSKHALPIDHVWSVTGWKAIDVVLDVGDSSADRSPPNKPREASDGFVWRAIFHELPAFDAWSFDVVMPCERLDISVAFLGVGESKLLTPTFGPYFDPDRLTVFASDLGEARVKGPVTMPRPVVPLILSILALGMYVLIRALSQWRIDWVSLNAFDGELMGAELVLIWFGYSMIRRPVYPVISGYRFITPPWPKDSELTSAKPVPPINDTTDADTS
jgi:hypothetical protein